MRLLAFLVTAACLLTTAPATVDGKTYFKETFDDLAYQTRWRYPSASSVASTSDTHPTAKFVVGTGKWYGDNVKDKGFHTTKDGHIYGASAKLESPLSLSVPGRNNVIIQYSVKHEQIIECGGGFIKLFPSSFQPERLTSKSHFVIQFGPDFCGTQTRDVTLLLHLPAAILDTQAKKKGGPPAHFTQALFTLKNKIRARQDHLTHTYTLILNRDHTFQILIDGQVTYYENGQPVQGKLMEHIDWQSNLPEEKRDKNKPDQTNPMALDQLDAHWIGFELWQVKAGSVFDNIIVTDSIEEAHAVRKASEATRAKETEMWQRAHYDQQQEASRVRQEIEQTRARQDKELAQAILQEQQKNIEAKKKTEL